MKQKKVKKWINACMLLGLCIVLVALGGQSLWRASYFFMGIGIGLMGTGLCVAWHSLRCPVCGRMLPLWQEENTGNSRCPHCGTALYQTPAQ